MSSDLYDFANNEVLFAMNQTYDEVQQQTTSCHSTSSPSFSLRSGHHCVFLANFCGLKKIDLVRERERERERFSDDFFYYFCLNSTLFVSCV